MDWRSKCTECGDCLLWQGPTNAKGHPKIGLKSARRVVWTEKTGKELRPDQLVTVTCRQSRCLEHLALTTKGEVARIVNARPDVKAKRSASSARTNRPKYGKLSMEQARYIRASEKLGKELAQELGVSTGLISHVRTGRSWKEDVNHFAGLGARPTNVNERSAA